MVYSYYFPSYGYVPPESLQERTPIAIDFKSAITTEDDEEVYPYVRGRYKPKYHLKIKVPRSNRRGLFQFISDDIVVPLGPDGVFRYKLAPSNVYYPVTRYVVEYYRRRQSIPLERQEWLVPPLLKTRKMVINYEEGKDEYVLPLNVWNVVATSPTAEYVSTYNRIIFISNLDFTTNTPITITYQPAITLDQVLEYNFRQLNDTLG